MTSAACPPSSPSWHLSRIEALFSKLGDVGSMISSRFTSILFTTALFLLPVAAQYYQIDSPGKQATQIHAFLI
ncbi:hypothetical protein E4U09_004977 [Claviceps aff. purpurea]|uniref:Uncharacterized protein n=1 Tax=Claviceps aff. purpurea TaxID=1967640 RepID=A0A9P7TZF2_9HYPO|nr:hypothetical protein E4U09_004977 [Claviceps aff. purpurea]